MSNYKSFRDFNYEITGESGNILDAIIKGYVKYYIDNGSLTCSSEAAIISIAESAVYTLKEFLGIIVDKCYHEYTNSAVGTVHKMKYFINTKDIKIDTIMPMKMLDPIDLRVSGLLSYTDLFIPLVPELDEFNKDSNTLSLIEIENNIPKILELVNKIAGEDASMERMSDITRLFGIDSVDFTVPDFDNKKLIMLVVNNVTSEIGSLSEDDVEIEEKVSDEEFEFTKEEPVKDSHIVGNLNIIKELKKSFGFAGAYDEKRSYTVAEGGVFGQIINLSIVNYLNIEKEFKDIFKTPKLSDALKVIALATTVFWDLVDDITADGVIVPEDIKFNITATLSIDEYGSVFIKVPEVLENEYRFDDEVIYSSEEELFERVCDCLNCTANEYNFDGDEEYDTNMLKILGAYIGSDFGVPVIDFIEEVRQRIIKTQDEIKSKVNLL